MFGHESGKLHRRWCSTIIVQRREVSGKCSGGNITWLALRMAYRLQYIIITSIMVHTSKQKFLPAIILGLIQVQTISEPYTTLLSLLFAGTKFSDFTTVKFRQE